MKNLELKPWMLWSGGALVLLALTSSSFSFGGNSTAKIDRDPAKLLPGFARKVEQLFRAMRARGFDPILWEGMRSVARAKELAAKGTGIADSMHSYGAAVDIVDRTLLWDAPKAFWAALGEEAQKLGLTWGGTFSDPDKPHVQAITFRQQAAFTKLSPLARAQYVA